MIPVPTVFFLAAAPHLAPHLGTPDRWHPRPPIHRPLHAPVPMDEIGIAGRTTEYDGMAHTYTIDGQVRIAMRDMTVTCDQAVISTSPDEQEVLKILFRGHVVATRAHDTFRGNEVTYFVPTRRLVAQGDTKTHIFLPRPGHPAVKHLPAGPARGGSR